MPTFMMRAAAGRGEVLELDSPKGEINVVAPAWFMSREGGRARLRFSVSIRKSQHR